MSLEIEKPSQGIQTIRVVADVIDNCNLSCHYCHPNFGWSGKFLSSGIIEEIFKTSENRGIFEVTLTGGEITLHPEFTQILEATHILDRTTSTFITNATRITPELAREVENSNIGRVCVSVDGPDPQTHNSRRGNNFVEVMVGLRNLREFATSKPITVISVAHQKNWLKIIELSYLLAKEKLADQHHICAPSYSGRAKSSYDDIGLSESQFYELQSIIDNNAEDLKNAGLFVTFNSFWPAIGKRGKSHSPRTMTLVQFTEQVKDIYIIIRPNGDVRLTLAAWGRETVGNAVVGNLCNEEAEWLFRKVDEIYRSGRVKQLPREVEAGHKFHVGTYRANYATTDKIINQESDGEQSELEWIAIRKLSEIDLLDNTLSDEHLKALATEIVLEPKRWRIVHHASGVDLVFDKKTSHTTVLRPEETSKLLIECEKLVQF